MDEDSSLTNPGMRKKSPVLYLWWALNVFIVIFVFLAFLMSTLSYTHSLNLANQVNNSYYTTQGGLIERTYTVAPSYAVKRGSVASFCGADNLQLCEGLGPVWNRPFFATESWSPAIATSIAQLTPSVSVYFHVVDADHTTLRATFIDTSSANPPSVKNTATLTLTSAVTSLHARPTSDPTVAAVMYTTHNETYLHTVTVTAAGTVLFSPLAVDLFHIYDPNQNGTLHRELATVETWLLVTYGYEDNGASYSVFTVDPSNAQTKLRSETLNRGSFGIPVVDTLATVYLGDGYILQSNAYTLQLGKVDFNAKAIQSLGSADMMAHFRFLQLHLFHNNSVLAVGTQTLFVDVPRTLTVFIEWSPTAPFLRTHVPTNLLGTQNHRPQNFLISLCYLPPHPEEPYGGVFFSYLDSISNRAKIARSRPVWSNNDLHLLPSPSLDISSHRYNRFDNQWTAPPTLTCNVGTGNEHVLVTLQDFTSSFNTFVWAGGYRYAGIAQDNVGEGKELDIVRAGISSKHERLIPGFSYYMWNNGTIAPYTSFHELFTPNGFPMPIGTAISNSQLHLEQEAFDRFF
jgi:hypothetical protein